jgi:arginine decarboxylase-like protein|tara:strand:- start:2727 stop:3032 length:306 start_codon:yes stop_codon:yes gene_type:complete
MLPKTFALSDTLTRLDNVMNHAEELLGGGHRAAAVDLITDTSDQFVSTLSQFDEGYFSQQELEKINAYEVILNICHEFSAAKNQPYDAYDDDEGEGDIYDW